MRFMLKSKTVKCLAFFTGGYALCLLLPFYLNVVAVAILVASVWRASKEGQWLIILPFITGSLFRIIVGFALLGALWLNPQHLVGLRERHPVIVLAVIGSEIGIYEGIVRYHCERIADSTDPFSGMGLREIGNLTYSIGPDGQDNYCRVKYDPTNGITSAGDIIVPIIRD